MDALAIIPEMTSGGITSRPMAGQKLPQTTHWRRFAGARLLIHMGDRKPLENREKVSPFCHII
jgi:hypothetical protein